MITRLTILRRHLVILISILLLLPFPFAAAADSESSIATILEAAKSGDDATLAKAKAALDNIAKPEKGDSASAKKLNDEGLAALKQGQSSSAIQLLKQACSADPSNIEAANNLGFALLKAGDNAAAEAALRKTIALSPGRSSAWLNLGEAMGAAGKTEQAGAGFYAAWFFSQNRDRTLAYVSKLAAGDNSALAGAAKQGVDYISRTSRPGSASVANHPSLPSESAALPAASTAERNGADVHAESSVSTPAPQESKIVQPPAVAPAQSEVKTASLGNAAVQKPGFDMSQVFEKLFAIGMVVLVVGLAKPAWIMRWSSSPTRPKLFLMMLAFLVPMALLAGSTKSPERLAYEAALHKQNEEARRQKAEQDARQAAEANIPLLYGSWRCIGSGEKVTHSSNALHRFGPDGFRAESNNNLSSVSGSFEQNGSTLTMDLNMTAPDGQQIGKRYTVEISKLDKNNLVYIMPFKYPVTYTCTR